MDTDGHNPSLFLSVRLSGSPIARYLEKFIEVFTEGVKCWRIDSVGHGRTRSVSLCVGSTERKSDRERLRKIHEVFTEGVKCWRIDSVGHGRTQSVSLFVGSTERKSDRERLQHFSALKAHYNFIYLVPIRALATSYCRKLFKGYLRNKRSFYYNFDQRNHKAKCTARSKRTTRVYTSFFKPRSDLRWPQK